MSAAKHLVAPSHTPHGCADKKISVLHLIHSVCHGGIESALINWVRYFDRERFNVHVACFAYDRNREEAFLRSAGLAGIHVLKVPWSRYKPFFKAARSVAQLARELDIDIVHTHAYYADVVGVLAARLAPVKTVATVYVWGKYEIHRQLMQMMDWMALRFTDKVTVHCDDTYRKTIRLGFRRNEVTTLIAGFPDERVSLTADERLTLRRGMGIVDDELLMLNVARIHPEKAHDQLLRSFKIVHERHPKTRLWISGVGWAELEQQLLALRDELGLQQAVEFIGFRQDLWPLLQAADMMVHPSHVEGVPIAILYGMSAALPIVVSNVGGVGEVIKPGKTGLLIAENDVQGFAETVIGLIEDRKEARRLGDGARSFVTNEYSISRAVEGVAQCYREVLAR